MNFQDEDLSSAVKECLSLFLTNMTDNPIETTLRLRALQSLSEGVSTPVVQTIARATERARAAGVLEDNLKAYLSGA